MEEELSILMAYSSCEQMKTLSQAFQLLSEDRYNGSKWASSSKDSFLSKTVSIMRGFCGSVVSVEALPVPFTVSFWDPVSFSALLEVLFEVLFEVDIVGERIATEPLLSHIDSFLLL
jgi:hypothetical protein